MILPARRGSPIPRNYRTKNRGLGFSYFDLLDQADREDCNPRDFACVGRNQQRVNAVQDLWNTTYLGKSVDQQGPLPIIKVNVDTSDRAVNQFMANQPVEAGISISGGPTYSATQLQTGIPRGQPGTQLPAAGSGAPRGGQLSFTTSRGGTALQIGDTWAVAIAGASPNSPVTVSGSMPGSSFSNSAMGSTDSGGNFSKSGTIGAGDVGSWQESWSVGGAPSGVFLFTVATLPQTPGGKTIINSAGAQNAPGSTAGSSVLKTGFDFSSIPTWGWAALAAGALFMFGGGRGR